MGIHQISRERMINTVHSVQTVRTGQIIQGKILKLYPNNKAQIQLGSQNMVAQLEASLAVGERYHFQVESTDNLIYLKVIGEHLKNRPQINITDLLQSLGLKVSKGNIDFVQRLMNEKVPFDRTHLAQAFSLLDGVKNKSESQQVLKDMMIQRLPMNESVLQALLAKNTTQLSAQLKAVLQQLEQYQRPTELHQNLLNRLRQMIEIPPTNQTRMITQIITEASMNNQQLFNTLKLAGIIDRNVEFSSWKSQWESFSNQNQSTAANRSNTANVQSSTPFPVNVNIIDQTLNGMVNSQTQLREQSQDIVSKWSSLINESVIRNMPLSEQNYGQFKNEISQKLLPLLTNNQQALVLEKLENNPVQLRQFLTTIQQYTFQQTYTNIEQILTTITDQDSFNTLLPQEKFLGQIRQMLLFSGLTDENLIAQSIIAGQQNNRVSNEQAQSLLRQLNTILNSQVQLRQESQEIVTKWTSQINEAIIRNMPLSEQNFELFKNDIRQKILPLLSTSQQELVMEKLQNIPVQLRQFLTTIQQYSMEQTYTKFEQVVTTLNSQEFSSALPFRENILGEIRQALLFSGLTDGNLLAQGENTQQQTQTIKSMLIQMLQQGEGASNERAQQLLHHINGLQIQSVQEAGNFIQASLVVPGEKLALNNDIYIEFESKKTEDGTINPDYCRILFYLDLANLRETIVDMQIQKRLVTITVFNDHETLKLQADQLQPSLKKGLESLNYQLANIMFKPLEERNKTKQVASTTHSMKNSYEGIEFRI